MRSSSKVILAAVILAVIAAFGVCVLGPTDVPRHEQYVRAGLCVLLLGFGLYVAWLLRHIERVRAREQHIKRVLEGIRNVNQLIVSEPGRAALIERAVLNLTETLGYATAWIALLDDTGTRAVLTACAGFGSSFQNMEDRLLRGDFPVCMKQAMADRNVVTIRDRNKDCARCVCDAPHTPTSGLAGPLIYAGRVYGALVVSAPPQYADDSEQHALFQELATDLGFALHRTEDAEALARAEHVIARSPAVVFVWDSVDGWPVTYVTPNVEERFGWPMDDLINGALDYATVIHPEDRLRVIEETEQSSADPACGTIAHAPYRVTTQAGAIRWVEDLTTIVRAPDGTVLRYEGVVLDVTARKEAQLQLEHSERRLSTLLNNLPGMIYQCELDRNWTMIFVSEGARDVTGLAAEALIGNSHKAYGDLIHEEDRDFVWNETQEAVNQCRPFELEYRIVDAEGRTRWVWERGSAIRNGSGTYNVIEGVILDVTEGVEATRARARTETRYRNLYEQAPIGIFATTSNGKVLEINQEMARILGCAGPEEAIAFYTDLASQLYVNPERRNEFVRRLRQDGSVSDFEYRAYRRDGAIIWLNMNARISGVDEDGGAIIEGFTTDVTARKEAEEELIESQAMLARTERVAHVGSWEWNPKTGQTTWSEEVYRIFGLDPAQPPPDFDTMHEQYHPEDRPRLLEAIDRARNEGVPYQVEARLFHTSGQVRHCYVLGFVEMGPNGTVERLFGSLQDITRRKSDEERLEMQSRVLEQIQDRVTVTNLDGYITYVNEAECRMLKLPREEIIGKHVSVYGEDPDQGATQHEIIENTLKNGHWRGEVVNYDSEGNAITLDSRTHVVTDRCGKPVALCGISTDITRRKKTETALRRSEEHYRDLAESTEAVPWEYDILEERWTYIAPQAERILGYPPEEWTGLEFWADRVADADREWVRRRFCECASRDGSHEIEYRFIRRDGQEIWVRDLISVEMREGKPVKMRGFKVDVSQRQYAEAERERLLSAVEQAVEIFVITDPNGTIQYVNPAFERITGYSPEEAIGQNPRILKSGEHGEAFYRDLWETLRAGKVWRGRMINKRKDGTLYTEEDAISPVRDATGQIVNFVAVKRDITNELQLEEQYRQAQKMEAIGQLTGGVAHDFNNLLQVISGSADIALDDIEEVHPARESVEEIAQAGERAGRLISQLLAFSRRQVMRPELLNLNDVVSELLKMLRRVIGEHIRLEWLPGKHVGAIMGDHSMVDQALMNLCVNARDAMPNGGVLTIETENVLIDSQYCASHAWAIPGRYVLVNVSDTGCGMDRATLDHVFEPFFTTKEAGRGTGLGLATVYGIVKQHEGMILAYSEVDKGSVFKLYFPISERKAESVGCQIDGPVQGGRETILVAEDDAMVRNLAKRILERAGYKVLLAEDGAEAVELFKQRADEVDMALMDVVMPELGGHRAYEQMRELRPDLRILFTSGYSENAVHTDFVLHDGLVLLQKPYSHNELLRAVRSVLDCDLEPREV